MFKKSPEEPYELIFHPFLPWLWVKVISIISLSGAFLMIGMQSRIYWLSSLALLVLAVPVFALQYFAQAIIIYGNDVTFRQGLFWTHSIDVPVWRVYLEITQSPLGQIFDYGTVRLPLDDRVIEMPVASLRTLHHTIAQRRAAFLPLLAAQDIIDVGLLQAPRRLGG